MALVKQIKAHEQLNPSLTVDACFSVIVDGERRNARLNLREYPQVALWLRSILDHILAQQGRLAGEHPITPPPAGYPQQWLIDAGILYTRPQPGGVLQLGLNPEFNVQLMLDARRSGARAHNTMLALAEDADLTLWLLRYFTDAPASVDISSIPPGVAESLRRHAVLVEELPPADAWYPDPEFTANLAADLAGAARVWHQPAGQPIPAEVRKVLGRHKPALPPGVDLIWAQDAGTGMVYPSRCAGDDTTAHIQALTGTAAAQRAAQWEQQREEARASVRSHRFAVLRDIVPEAQQLKLRRYVRQLRERGYFPELNDGQVALRASIHNQPTIASLHNGLAGIVNTIGEEQVIPSYCYLSCYEEGAVLDRHLDRSQCAYNLCLVLDMQYLDRDGDPEPWPIYLELDGKPVPALMRVGDGVFFSGRSIYHWRDALPANQRAVVCFYHFVPPGFGSSLD